MDQRFVSRKARDDEFYDKCWRLVRVEGLTYAEAGKRLGVSKNVVAGIVNRIKKQGERMNNERTNPPR